MLDLEVISDLICDVHSAKETIRELHKQYSNPGLPIIYQKLKICGKLLEDVEDIMNGLVEGGPLPTQDVRSSGVSSFSPRDLPEVKQIAG